jgi:hypothetical protein
MKVQLFVWSGGVALVMVAYLALWAYANQDNSIRCNDQSGTPVHIGLTDYRTVWGYFGSAAMHCISTPRKK